MLAVELLGVGFSATPQAPQPFVDVGWVPGLSLDFQC